MPNQTGLKHVGTEPTKVETKRERRRGAQGRASALRRAPSDSDCSGETASLSADSGDRSVRVPAPPPRTGKSRGSRRRGSEWEVLEGLKDGQRFDKRPEVFNGYLHKKRKWPLKGWHKRFFVIDGGILVYARSPTDVSRGRLHGSVDVGLSVISAKARRRRIDIDADEFIYHLRAKTPDMFRTWLNVLKAHRLYRQHLLTFGARESVPKIHAPSEDLPPTDTSSHTTISSSRSIYRSSSIEESVIQDQPPDISPLIVSGLPYCTKEIVVSQLINKMTDHISPKHDMFNNTNMLKTNCNIEAVDFMKHKSLCSMQCVIHKRFHNCCEPKQCRKTLDNIYPKQQSTELDTVSRCLQNSSLICQYSLNSSPINTSPRSAINNSTVKPHTNITKCGRVEEKSPKFFFLSRKRNSTKQSDESVEPMRRSKKSTNLVKYRNVYEEPKLEKPISKCVLLGKYKMKDNICIDDDNREAHKQHKETQADIVRQNKSLQEAMSIYEYDEVTEKLMTSVFDTYKHLKNINDNVKIKNYINQIVKELYDMKFNSTESHPVKILFRCLLEYWLKTTSFNDYKRAVMKAKSIDKQSFKYFTEDENLSCFHVPNLNKQTQMQGVSIKENVNYKRQRTDSKKIIVKESSYKKERQIQEIERMLKNTVYICNTIRSSQSKEKDIRITKKLIDNIENLSHGNKFDDENMKCEDSNSSNEFAKIQDTIKHLISDTSMPPALAKDFLNAYLDLLHGSRSVTDTSTSQDDSQNEISQPLCDVQTESVQKKVSRCITTKDLFDENTCSKCRTFDPGQLYLKDVLDNITTLFSRDDLIQNFDKNTCPENTRDDLKNDKIKSDSRIVEKISNNVVVRASETWNGVNFSKENTIKEIVQANHPIVSRSSRYFENTSIKRDVVKDSPYIDNDMIVERDFKLRPYTSSNEDSKKYGRLKKTCVSDSDATSKAYRVENESKTSIEVKEEPAIPDSLNAVAFDKETQSCYLLSLKRLVGTFNQKKKVTSDNQNTVSCSTTPDPLEGIAIFAKEPRQVDEKFILLLLENICLVSKNIPSMYKDINVFYAKMKKKYEKAILNSGKIQGLSLLGKIYNEDTAIKKFVDKATQHDVNDRSCEACRECGTSTADIIIRCLTYDSATSACCFKTDSNNANVQTDNNENIVLNTDDVEDRIVDKKFENAFIAFSSTQTNSLSIYSSDDDIKKANKDVSTNRQIYTKECAINTLIKFILDDSSRNYKIACTSSTVVSKTKKGRNVAVALKMKPHRKHSTNVRNSLIREMSLLAMPFKVSTQSQTERSLQCIKDYQICQLFFGNKFQPKKNVSLSDSNADMREKSDDLKTLYRCSSYPSYCSESGGPLDNVSRELGQAQLSVQQLQRLLDALEQQQQAHHDTDVSIEGASPNVKKDRRKFGLRKKKSSNKCASIELAPPHIDPSNSHMALSTLTAPPSPGGCVSSVPNSAASLPIACAATRPQSLPGAEALNAAPTSLCSLTPDHHLREDFTVLAKDLVTSLKSIVATLVCERGRLRVAMESAEGVRSSGGTGMVAALRTNLSTALQQNSELRSRLSRIHDASDLAEISSVGAISDNPQFKHSLSYSSSCVSASEFFDAEEHEDDDELKPATLIANESGVIELDGDSTSEAGSLSSEDGSASSDNSETPMGRVDEGQSGQMCPTQSEWSRRSRLPSPRPTPGGPSLWNLLYKNIGKDLSQISMPVTINEPLNMLQRLCEELEYSELLDSAASCSDSVERMSMIAAFAVSAYAASAHRAASKPFNPLLAETYECVREDKGFRFLAEQVSHHPPVSACHAESSKWVFWQEARIKTKFWGKSMEFQPAGRVHLRLLTTGDHYTWNKVTTCVHNLFGGQRWVDQYGEMHIVCHGTDITCKLNFVKASSWSNSRHEVRGAVYAGGAGRTRLHGRWAEALLAGEPPAARCLWRPGAMPPEYEMYYGFTRFAMELNEMEPALGELLPHTDTRFRPDQRALEEGDVDGAEQYKLQLEQSQRERRRLSSDHTPAWFRKKVEEGEETWVFAGQYWREREVGFPANTAPRLW